MAREDLVNPVNLMVTVRATGAKVPAMKYAGLFLSVSLLGAVTGCGGGGGGGTGKGGSGPVTLCPGTGGTTAAAPPACSSNPSDYQYRFQDPCAPIEERIDDLLKQMTAEEKLGLMSEYQFPVDRLGVPGFTTFTEGLHGVGWASAVSYTHLTLPTILRV